MFVVKKPTMVVQGKDSATLDKSKKIMTTNFAEIKRMKNILSGMLIIRELFTCSIVMKVMVTRMERNRH